MDTVKLENKYFKYKTKYQNLKNNILIGSAHPKYYTYGFKQCSFRFHDQPEVAISFNHTFEINNIQSLIDLISIIRSYYPENSIAFQILFSDENINILLHDFIIKYFNNKKYHKMVRKFYDTIFRQIKEDMEYTVTVLDKLTEYRLPQIYEYTRETILTHYHYDVLLSNLMEHKIELFDYKDIMCDLRIVKYCMMFDISVFDQMLKSNKDFKITYDSIKPFLEINGNIIKFDRMRPFRNNVHILEHSLRVNPEAIVWLLLDDSIDYNNVGLLIHTARNLIIDKSLITFQEEKVKIHSRGRDIRYPLVQTQKQKN